MEKVRVEADNVAGEPNLSLRRSKRIGSWLCLGALAAGAIFLIGLFQGAYWALAIPVAGAVLAVLSLAFWIGYTINMIEVVPKEADHYEGEGARRIALGICAGSVGLAAVFLLGILQGSYLALAIPVGAAVVALLAMIFWIGWAIVTQKTSLPGEREESAGAEPPSAGTTGEPGSAAS